MSSLPLIKSGVFELKVIESESACRRFESLASSLSREFIVDMYCSKNVQQRARESMRNQRLKNRTDELLQIVEDEANDDSSMDVSNVTGQDVTDPNDSPDVTTCEDSKRSYVDGSPKASLSNASHHEDEDEDEDEDEVFESDSSDEDVDDFLFNYDLNNQTKLFPSCPLSIADACLAILKLARHLNLDKSGMKHLLDCIRSICPIDMKLPRTINALMKIIGEWIGS